MLRYYPADSLMGMPYLAIITARKRSLGQGNIFTSVRHSVQRGEGVASQHGSQVTWPGGLHPGGSASGRGVCIWRSTAGGICIQGGLGRSAPAIEYFGIRSTSWRYTSYWNAFLLLVMSTNEQIIFIFSFFLGIIQASGPSRWRRGSRYTLWTCCGGGWKQRLRTSGWTVWSTRWSARPWRRRGPRLDNSSMNRNELCRCLGPWIMADTTQHLRGTFKFTSRQ